MKSVSIIIPAYNAEKWIALAIDSVLGQSWTNLEVIVVDDGSKDATIEMVEEISDSRVRLIRQENRGASAARNRGLIAANGDFIQYLDADDWLSPDKIENQLKALQNAPAGSIASCTWGKFVNDPGDIKVRAEPVWRVSDPLEWLICSLTGGGMMQPGAWLTPRPIIDRAGPWDESLSLHDDGEYFARVLLQADQNVFVEGSVVGYRVVDGSLSQRRGRKAVESALDVCRSRTRHLLSRRDDERVRRAIATQYGGFLYEFAGCEADLTSDALALFDKAGCEPEPCFGGRAFRKLVAVVGFTRALKIREQLLRLKAMSGGRIR